VVNYETQDFVQEVKRLTDRRGVEVVFEHVGKRTWEGSILSAALGGRIVTVGATTGYDPPTDLRHVFYRQLSVLGSTMGTAGELVQVLRHVAERRLRPVIDRGRAVSDLSTGMRRDFCRARRAFPLRAPAPPATSSRPSAIS